MQKELNENIDEILKTCHKIAVVGVSDKPYRDSYKVAQVMKNAGYQVFPVNPNVETVLGLKSYASLKDIEESVDLVDVFRKPEQVGPIVDEAIRIGAKAVWLQLGVINPSAAQKALDAGLDVVMDHCWKIEYQDREFRD